MTERHWTLRFTAQAERDLDRLDRPVRERMYAALERPRRTLPTPARCAGSQADPSPDYGRRLAGLGPARRGRRWPLWRLREDTRVLFQADAGSLDIARACAAHDVLICAGKWTDGLLGDTAQLPLHYTREQVT